MSQVQEVATQLKAMNTIVGLTSVFEGIASMRIAQVKSQVLQSQKFFSELWQIYSQIRVDNQFRFGRHGHEAAIDKQLYIIITSEGGFSGDIDQKLITWMLEQYKPEMQDIIVVGHHGAIQLIQNKVAFKKYFTLPSRDRNINVQPLVNEVSRYRSTVVFYQSYVSLMAQDVKRIELQTAVTEEARQVNLQGEDVISEFTYIFEPSSYDVIAHLERSMVQIALSQVILDSKLAQYASRFRAMNLAHERADDLFTDLTMQYNRTKRRVKDERLKEMINGLRKTETA
ncbi:MAG TPA: F0F1 ATP synthase subunit gamma [Candidatus Saccharimonadales bacterium]|nr:F0F1 ATP synthase subunit gamma [Candidatus Saccharimonadales bacterium]